MSASASAWWDRLSPERQRAHIKRHPRGKYAVGVRKHAIKLKPIQRKGSKKAVLDVGGGKAAQGEFPPDGGDNPDDDAGEDDESENEDGTDEDATDEPKADDETSDDAEEDSKPDDQQPTPPTPPRADLAESYRASLPEALKTGVRAFFGALAGGQRLGQHADLGGIRDAAANGDIPAIVRRMNPPDNRSAGILRKTMKALMPLAKVAAITTLGVTATMATGGMVPAMLAAYYINRHLDTDSVSRTASISSDTGDECDKLVNSFMDWVESLDAEKISSASSADTKFEVRMCPTQAYIEDPAKRGRYIIVCGNSIRGVIQWDRKYGDPDLQANGWNAVLMHGFNESSWQSGRDKSNLEPYTTIFRNDVVLVNPARMPFEFARNWALSVLRR